jgi:hypothetical protein
MKTLGSKFVLVTTILGILVPSIFMPEFIVWYGEPIVPNGISCGPTVAWSLNRFIAMQIASALVFLILALIVRYKWNQRRPSA